MVTCLSEIVDYVKSFRIAMLLGSDQNSVFHELNSLPDSFLQNFAGMQVYPHGL